jgi:outer membrane protein TolC
MPLRSPRRGAGFAVCLGLLAGSCPPAFALTLAEAVAAAAALQPGAELEPARAAEGAALTVQAGSLFAGDPSLILQHYNDGVGSGDAAREWDTGLVAPLWLPGQRAARRDVAAAVTRQAAAGERERRWRVAGEVRNRLWNVIEARQRARRLQIALDDARVLEQSIGRRVDAGDLARSDLLLARRETLMRSAALIEAQAGERLALSRWRVYTGLGELPDEALEIQQEISAIDDSHPALEMANAAADRRGSERDRARSQRRANPTINVGTRHERGPDESAWNDAIAVGVEVPLGLASQSAPAVSAAEFAYAEAAVARQRLVHELADQLDIARSDLDAARAAVAPLCEARAAVAASEEQAQRAFDIGEESLLALMQIRAQAQDAAARCEAMEQQVGRGIARVNQAAGHVPE